MAVAVALPERDPLSELDAVDEEVPVSLGESVCDGDTVDVLEKV